MATEDALREKERDLQQCLYRGEDEANQRRVVFIFTTHMEPEAKSLQRNTALLFRSEHAVHTHTACNKDRRQRRLAQWHRVMCLLAARAQTLQSDRSSCFGLPKIKYTLLSISMKFTKVQLQYVCHIVPQTATKYSPEKICSRTLPVNLLTVQQKAISHASHTVYKLYLHGRREEERGICYAICRRVGSDFAHWEWTCILGYISSLCSNSYIVWV